jgi:transposase-like protein
VAEQRYQAVMAVIGDGLSISQVAEKVGVSRQTLHSWLARYEAENLEGLKDRSHRPVSSNRMAFCFGGRGRALGESPPHPASPCRGKEAPTEVATAAREALFQSRSTRTPKSLGGWGRDLTTRTERSRASVGDRDCWCPPYTGRRRRAHWPNNAIRECLGTLAVPRHFGDVGDADQQYRVGGANE